MKINVYCENRGWLFEDLKQLIASKGATPSEKPLSGYDKYICIRTKECKFSPSSENTLVQVHDMGEYDLRKYGLVSLVHPSQADNVKGCMEITPIGSRDIRKSGLPQKPTVGFFCREVKGHKKGSEIFAEVVQRARQEIDFDVLMVGQKLQHIKHLGKYEERAADVNDYSRITALFTASQTPMIPLSVYEAISVGRSIITTPRVWTADFQGIFEGKTVDELVSQTLQVVKQNKLWQSDVVFKRDAWAEQQIKMVQWI